MTRGVYWFARSSRAAVFLVFILVIFFDMLRVLMSVGGVLIGVLLLLL